MKKNVRKSVLLGICAAAVVGQAQVVANELVVQPAAGGCGGKHGCNNNKGNKKVTRQRPVQ
ncbi:MAG: hypothetical protein JSR37_00700 [Verrucomicrobia bacterium]|nr:hypothetical protein [Verrucomicrobiota bacterium]